MYPDISTIIEMAAKKVLVVFGATGVQGGSVVKAILGDPKMKADWAVRGVTRDVSKPSAKALEDQGAETIAVSHYRTLNILVEWLILFLEGRSQ